jgi:hypothetical protein
MVLEPPHFSRFLLAFTFVMRRYARIWNLPKSGWERWKSAKTTFLHHRALFAQLCAMFARLGWCVQQIFSSSAGKTAFDSLGTVIALEKRSSAFGGGENPFPNRKEP